MFSGLLVYDTLTIFMRMFLFGSTAVVMIACLLTGIPDREDSADFNCLLLGAALGMSLMASSNHLMMIFLAVEMASLPSYALSGFLKGRRQSSEAALKYVVYGGGASGIMLYGISMIAGKFGTGFLPDVAAGYAAVLQAGGFDAVLLLGTFFILVGVAFKLSAVPFHFWCPDVFEGAAAEVAGFLSVVSKGAALAMLARFALVLAGVAYPHPNYDTWLKTAHYLTPALAFFAALTATFGNFAAYMQTNLKRLLAYSTIAHAGYMLMGLAPLSKEGAASVLFYLVAYLLMNLGAFAVIAFLRNQTGSEDLDSYRGLVRKSPVMVITLAFFLLSLLGIPPLIGFFAKFQVFSVLWNDGQTFLQRDETGLGYTLLTLLVIGGLNTVVSVVYYVKVLKVMILDAPPEEAEGRPVLPLRVPAGAVAYASILAAATLIISIFVNPFLVASREGVNRFHRPAAPVVKVAEITR
jgi:NADH-quinone oxidoreductase subunit N